jgi:dTDP-4-dehydrorhamnose reductase
MDVLVLGAYGMLGHRLLLDLSPHFDAVGAVRTIKHWDAPIMEKMSVLNIVSGMDATDLTSVSSIVRRYKPAVIVNCIGIVKNAPAAKDPITTISVNSLFPHQLLSIANQTESKLIHISTDCVFSGKEGNYKQDANPDPIDMYGRSKLLGEIDDGALTLRSSLIGRELGSQHGLVEWFLANRGKSVSGYRHAIFTGFPTHEMSKIIAMLIEKSPIENGIWHVASDPISKYDLLSKINTHLGTTISISEDEAVHCDRSLNGKNFSKSTGYRAPGWDDMIKSMVGDFDLYEGGE